MTGTVTSKTNYLINNDVDSTSSKIKSKRFRDPGHFRGRLSENAGRIEQGCLQKAERDV